MGSQRVGHNEATRPPPPSPELTQHLKSTYTPIKIFLIQNFQIITLMSHYLLHQRQGLRKYHKSQRTYQTLPEESLFCFVALSFIIFKYYALLLTITKIQLIYP